MNYIRRRRLDRAVRVMLAALLVINGMPRGALATSVGDVFVITMENHNATQPGSYTSTQAIYGNANAPYLNSLITANNPNAAQTSWASNYTSLGSGIHPSEPNYIWSEAGTNFGITNDNLPYGSGGNAQTTNQHLTGMLQASGISWKSYQEDIDLNTSTGAVLRQSSWTVPLNNISGTMPGGATPNPYNGTLQYNYAPKHNPMAYFSDTNGGNNTTTSNPQRLKYAPLQQLQTDLTNNTVSKFNFITPDQFNDMHTSLSGGFTYNSNHLTGDSAQIAQGDNFLSIIVPQIMASQAYQNNGAILIWFDETEGGDTSSFTLPYILISPLAKGNAYQSTVNFTHSSTLRTLQEILQVAGGTNSGFLGGAASASDQSDMFQAGVIPTTLPDPIWNGTGSTNNWSTANNWQKVPSAASNLTFAGTTRLSNTNDSLSSVGSITFSNTAGAFTLSGSALTVAGGITNNSANLQTIGINLTLAAAQQFNAASGNLTVVGTIANGGNALTVTGGSNTTLSGSISGLGSLTKIGAGTLLLSGNNSYSGGTTLSNGTVQLGHANGLGSSTAGVTVNGGTLDLYAFSPTTGALNGTGGSIFSNTGAAALTFGNGGGSGSYPGTISNGTGTVSLIKTGAGTQTISGNNSYSGGTTVTGGTLQVGNVNAMGSSSAGVTVNSGTVDLHGFSPTIGALNGSGGAIQTNVAGAVSLTVGNGGAGGSYAGTIQNNTGTVSLLKTGAGTQTLTGNNSYSGGTTVTTGTLIAGHVNALGTGGLTINNTATTRLQAGLSGPVQLPSLSLAGGGSPTATLDITDNNLILHNGNLATTTAQIANAFLTGGGGLWTGTGITSSLAEPDVTLHAVGVISNDDSQLGGGGDPLFGTWPTGADSGSAVTTVASDVLVKYTYFGDADLSGDVDNANDYGLWLAGLTGTGTGWLFGDFDYSGGATDNSSDYGLWLAGLTGQGAPLVGGGVQPVPEPSTLVLAALGLLSVAAWRRRQRAC